MDSAAQDVQAAINASAGTLPTNLPYPPVYSKVNPADAPILSLALTSDSVPIDKISDAADTILQPKLSQIDGVGKVTVQGGLRPAVRVRVDPARVAAYGLVARGRAHRGGRRQRRTAPRAASTAAASPTRSAPTTSCSRPTPTSRSSSPTRTARRCGCPTSAASSVASRTTASPAGTTATPPSSSTSSASPAPTSSQPSPRSSNALPTLQRSIPAQVRMQVVTDRTETIRASVERRASSRSCWRSALVVFVIYLFLRSARATLIPAVALPLSLIGTFGVMSLCGYSLDNLSLMALTVATGFVVDDAIVMIENVVRYIEEGYSPLEAAYRGARQIGFTIVSLTVSLVAVFIPLLFMTGVVGRLFNEFAVVLSTSVIVSAVVSLTLTPMMCGRLLRREERPSWLTRWFERGFDASARFYHRTLMVALRPQGIDAAGRAWPRWSARSVLYLVIPKGFLPQQDTGVIVAVTEAAQSASIPRMQTLQTAAGRDRAAGPGGDRRVVVRRRRVDQRDAEHRPADHRAQAAAASATTSQIVIARLQPRHGRHARHERVHAAGAGHPDRHPHQPHPVPIHADRHRRARAQPLGAAPARRGCARCPICRTSRPTSRPRASRSASTSTATPRCGSASRCRRCRTRSTTRSASARSARSSARPTNIASCWRPIPSWQARPARRSSRLRVPGLNGAQVPLSAIARIDAHASRRWRSRTRRSSRR